MRGYLLVLLSLLIVRFGVARIAGEPQWAICGESFPVGCRFDERIGSFSAFSANPDRRSRQYSTPTGAYRPGAALAVLYRVPLDRSEHTEM